jgi:predicted regulator of Ras-like GTPase activity (Roadblock/LC7/MglB family)
MNKRKKSEQIVAETEPIVMEETTPMNNLKSDLEEIKDYDGVIGYILRNSTSAAIDLKDPTKIIEYAIVSSSAFDAGKELSDLFDLDVVKSIIVEGKELKMLCVTIDENKVSVFMDKNASHEKTLKKLQAL